jgi:predicted NBD/HSP70 family sugar kinase
VSVKEVFQLYEQEDPLCRVLVNQAAEALANLIMNLVRMTDPDTVVLGGGVVADGFLLELVENYLHPVTMRFVKNGVVLTKLNPEFAGLLGAAAIAID